MENFKHLLENMHNWIPFVLSTGATPKLSVARIIEALIIAGVTGAIIMYSTTQVLAVRLDNIERSQNEASVWYKEVQQNLKQVEIYIYTHEHENK